VDIASSSQHPDLDRVGSVHLVGIGGAAMTPLATILLDKGVRVSGSDLVDSSALIALRGLGASVVLGHHAEHVGEVDVVVVSSAVPQDNPEIESALARGIPVIKHSVALGSLMRRRRGVAIAGTHGKTTTTALAATVLEHAGLDPTFHVGSELLNFHRSGRYGRGDLLVAEADEFDRRFLDYDPEIAVVTSVQPDHLDYFGDFASLKGAFEEFLARVRPGGTAVISADDPVARDLPVGHARRVTYGSAFDADWRLLGWEPAGRLQGYFTLRDPEGHVDDLEIHLTGRHNAMNAAAVVAVCSTLGLSMDEIAAGLSTFQGTRRRFEVVGEVGGITVVDDYAHHPTAIGVTLAAARAHFGCPLWAIFQPHTVHRTLSLWNDFLRCFQSADHVILVPTYRPPGREAQDEDPTVADLAREMQHPDARWLPAEEVPRVIVASAQRGDLVLILGAGDVWTVGPQIIAGLEARLEATESPAGMREDLPLGH